MGKSNSRKSCPSGKIMNPKSGRCVSKNGKIGRRMVGKSPRTRTRKSSMGKTKGCPSGKIMNPKTGRCVSKTGKIGMGLMGKAPRGQTRSKPSSKPKGEPRGEPKNDTTYNTQYDMWYKYYYDMFMSSDCKDVDAKEINERDIIDESDDDNTLPRRTALTEVIVLVNEICKQKKNNETEFEPPCEVDNYNPDDLSCKVTSSLLLHPDKNPACPIKASEKFNKWRSRCQAEKAGKKVAQA